MSANGAQRRSIHMPGVNRLCVLATSESNGVSHISARVAHANTLSSQEFLHIVEGIYQLLHCELKNSAKSHAVRMWNFIPGIHDRMSNGLERYRLFNQARFNAFLQWFGDQSAFPAMLPTATGVGHRGHALAVHVLGVSCPGQALENPRQRPAFQYSKRHGPHPPCFSRAMIARLPDGPRLLIGGTASVRGEDSIHDSLADQLSELLQNIRSLLQLIDARNHRSLRCLDEVRIYHRCAEHREQLEAEMAPQFTGARRIEFIQADICRRELLVEIEGSCPLGVGSWERPFATFDSQLLTPNS